MTELDGLQLANEMVDAWPLNPPLEKVQKIVLALIDTSAKLERARVVIANAPCTPSCDFGKNYTIKELSHLKQPHDPNCWKSRVLADTGPAVQPEDPLADIYRIATRALAEPGDQPGKLVAICTLIEDGFAPAVEGPKEWRVFPTQDVFPTRQEAEAFRDIWGVDRDIQYRTPPGLWVDDDVQASHAEAEAQCESVAVGSPIAAVEWPALVAPTTPAPSPSHFVSAACAGEYCGMCYREGKDVPATHKVGEEIPHDYPAMKIAFGSGEPGSREVAIHPHNLTQYVCCRHFASIMGRATHDWRGCEVNG